MSTVLEFYSSKDLLHRTSVREGETKLGQILPTISEADFNADEPLNYRFVIVGIEEDYAKCPSPEPCYTKAEGPGPWT